jgi:hypothetical protein
MQRALICLCLIMGILLVGCHFPGITPAPATVTTSPIPGLTVEQLKNFTYHTPQFNRDAPLQNGVYDGGAGVNRFSVSLLPELAFGDLDGDGVEDAAVLLAENGGGSGVFVSLVAVLNVNGVPLQAYDEFVDDRPVIHSLKILNGEILLDIIIHGPADPMVSPSFAAIKSYRLGPGGLMLTRVVSYTPNGAERSITIDSPKDGDVVTGLVQVKGSMPIGPFENNLAFHIRDSKGDVISAGPFMVNAEEPGSPAIFEPFIDFSAFPKGDILLQLIDVSMADGSIIALDSVELIVQ